MDLIRNGALNAFDKVAHAKQVAIARDLTGGDNNLAALILERTGERMECTGFDRCGFFSNEGADIGRDLVTVVGQFDQPFFHAPPELLGLPGALMDFLGDLGIEGTPVPDRSGQEGVGGEAAHVGIVADDIGAACFCGLQGGRSILVHGQDIGTDVKQAVGGIPLGTRVEPGLGPDDAHFGVRVDAFDPQGKGVDAADNFWDREGGNVADDVLLGHLAGDDPGQVAWFIHAAEVGADIVSGLVAGAVHEDDLRVALGNIDGGIHVAEAGGENQVVAALHQPVDDPGRFRTFRNRFNIGRWLDVRELFHLLAPLVVSVGPTGVSDGADIDEPGFDFFDRFSGQGSSAHADSQDEQQKKSGFFHRFLPFLSAVIGLEQHYLDNFPWPVKPLVKACCRCCFSASWRPTILPVGQQRR